MDEAGFSDYVAEAFRRALPGVEISVTAPLMLTLAASPDPVMLASLDRTYDLCRRNPPVCAQTVAGYIHQIGSFTRQPEAEVSVATLRAVVRPSEYVASLQQMAAASVQAKLVASPFPGDVKVVCYLDAPNAMRPVTASEIESLGLTEAQAIAAGTRNVGADLPPLRDLVKPLAGREIGIIEGDAYESSRLLLHDEWAPVAQELGGHLLVAVPASDVVLYAAEVDPAAVDAVAVLTREVALKAGRAISLAVYRWTKTGWELARP
jgi:hypothetical protein